MFSAAAAKSLQSCPTLCDSIDGSPPGSPVPGILQARTLEWVAISFSNAWKWKGKVKLRSRVRLLASPWTAACQAPPTMGSSRQEFWSGVPLPSLDIGVYSFKFFSVLVLSCVFFTVFSYFYFFKLKAFSNFPCVFLSHFLFRTEWFNLHIFVNVSNFLLLLIWFISLRFIMYFVWFQSFYV